MSTKLLEMEATVKKFAYVEVKNEEVSDIYFYESSLLSMFPKSGVRFSLKKMKSPLRIIVNTPSESGEMKERAMLSAEGVIIALSHIKGEEALAVLLSFLKHYEKGEFCMDEDNDDEEYDF